MVLEDQAGGILEYLTTVKYTVCVKGDIFTQGLVYTDINLQARCPIRNHRKIYR